MPDTAHSRFGFWTGKTAGPSLRNTSAIRGDHHIGISICTKKQELASYQYDLLPDEPERHRDRAVNRRTSRSEPRHGERNGRVFRARRADKQRKNGSTAVSRGKRSIRRQRSPYRPGDTVWIGGKRHVVHGAHCGGARIILENGKSAAVIKVDRTVHTGGWRQL